MHGFGWLINSYRFCDSETWLLVLLRFLGQLLDSRHAEDYVLPVPLKLQPRRYQQEGINWLAFLRRFGLHGILADVRGAVPCSALLSLACCCCLPSLGDSYWQTVCLC